MNAFFAALPGVDARQGMLEHLTLVALRCAAEALGMHNVLLGDTANRCAERVLAAVAHGAGNSIALDVATMDVRHHLRGVSGSMALQGETEASPTGVTFMRPLADTERKEIALFARWSWPDLRGSVDLVGGTPVDDARSAPSFFAPSFFTSLPPRSSLYQAVANLASMLQASFPNSVFNVLRTTYKLKLPHGVIAGTKPEHHAKRHRVRDRILAKRAQEGGTAAEEGGGNADAPKSGGAAAEAGAQPQDQPSAKSTQHGEVLAQNTSYVPCPLCGGVLTGVEMQRAITRGGSPALDSIVCFRCRAWLPAMHSTGQSSGDAANDGPLQQLLLQSACFPVALAADIAHAASAAQWAVLCEEQKHEADIAGISMRTAESAAALARSLAAAAAPEPPQAAEQPAAHAPAASVAVPMSRREMQASIAQFMLEGYESDQ